MTKKRICVFTGTRAEYGLLRPLMEEISSDPDLQLQLLVSGTHLSPEFGLTFNEIEKNGFCIDEKIEILLSSDTHVGTCKTVGLGLISFGEAFERLEPDCAVVLGDRFEAFAAVAAAMISNVPVAHLHGGESTLGLIDEPIRHSITKMSHLHFTSTEIYRNRVIQLGESPLRVFYVGALGLDSIKRLELLDKKTFENRAGFCLGSRSVLITFHPVTLEKNSAGEQVEQLLSALDHFPDLFIIFTKSNADEQGRLINHMISDYVKSRSNCVIFTSMGQQLYLSAVKHVNAVVGNSSSGIIEAPSLFTPTVNIGIRQGGRIKAESVIDCKPVSTEIIPSMEKALSKEFQLKTAGIKNPYEKEDTVKNIIKILKQTNFDTLEIKEFFDFPIIPRIFESKFNTTEGKK